MLTVTDLAKSYDTPQGQVPVFKGVSFEINAGESVALMGESGSGKSTLLHLVAGLEPATGGTILVGGEDITALAEAERAALRRACMSLVFQQFNLITSLTVRDNLAFEAKLAGVYDPTWNAKLTDILGLGGLLDRYPEEISGGQQQRVAIGRSFAAKPSLILTDEPTGNLDEANSDAVLELALGLVRETGAALLMATHSERLAAKLDRRLTLSQGTLA